MQFVANLPTGDTVGLFGLHANAKISFEKQETDKLISTVTSIQPRLGGAGGGDGKGPEETVSELAAKLLGEVPQPMEMSEAGEATFARNEKGDLNAIQIVLQQEMVRFNKLLNRVAQSLKDLGKAILGNPNPNPNPNPEPEPLSLQPLTLTLTLTLALPLALALPLGLVVMSGELDAMFSSMLVNQVPGLWTKVSYPSLKPLSSWIKDLLARVAFMRGWLTTGQPACFNLPAFFFPQGFMTGVLQMHARTYAIPIDTLSYCYTVRTEETAAEIEEPPVDGVYIDGFFLDGARWDLAVPLP